MNGRKVLSAVLAVLVLLLAVAAGTWFFVSHYYLVDFKVYPKDAEYLNLKGKEISIEHFEKVRQRLPDCDLYWDVPFQGSLQPSDAVELTVDFLTDQDVNMLDYFPQLKTLKAEHCTDYAQLTTLVTRRPELEILCSVPVNGQVYGQDTKQITLSAITEEELTLLSCLKQLETVMVSGGEDTANIGSLQEYCHEKGIDFCLVLGNAVIPDTSRQIRPEGVTDAQLNLLQFLPELEQVHLVSPAASAENVIALQETRTDLEVTWEQNVCGQICQWDEVDIDLSEAQIATLEEVEQAMAYLPNAQTLFLGECGIDNEEIAAYRERSRENYKVVWVVDLSGKMKVRTDIDNFMPSRDGWGYVREGEVDNIRYCEDLICIDLGHMGLKTVDFLEPLVNLEYLILAHTEVRYIDAISNCKKLKYLELDWSCIRDLTPLLECKKLEDLNIGMAWPDITPVLQMTWLKNLYMIKGSGADAWKCTQALPNTHVVASGEYTVASGWRHLPNYYAMRDILGMFYMDQ